MASGSLTNHRNGGGVPAVVPSAKSAVVVQYYDPVMKDWYVDDAPGADLVSAVGLYTVLEDCGVRLHATPYEVIA